MIQIGQYNTLTINRKVDFGMYLDDGGDGILLPKRFVPRGAKIGDDLEVFYTMMERTELLQLRKNLKALLEILFC